MLVQEKIKQWLGEGLELVTLLVQEKIEQWLGGVRAIILKHMNAKNKDAVIDQS